MSDLERERREMAAVLQRPGRRSGSETAAHPANFHPQIVSVRRGYGRPDFRMVAVDQYDRRRLCGRRAVQVRLDIRHASVSEKSVNTRFVEKMKRAAKEVQAMDPPADFLIFGGDIAQLGSASELELGFEICQGNQGAEGFHSRRARLVSATWAQKWKATSGMPNWTLDHKGVRFIGLDTVSRGPDYWTARKMSPEERMDHMATLDGTVAGPWAGVGRDQLDWLQKTLADWDKSRPVIIFSHNPLYEYYPPWNFWVRDWREVQAVSQALHQRHQHPRPRPSGALQRDRHNALDRHAGDVLAMALCAGGRAQAHPCR